MRRNTAGGRIEGGNANLFIHERVSVICDDEICELISFLQPMLSCLGLTNRKDNEQMKVAFVQYTKINLQGAGSVHGISNKEFFVVLLSFPFGACKLMHFCQIHVYREYQLSVTRT